jgi:hypothetical protein
MFNRTPRWNWLFLFALGNLLFWIAVAVAVGVLATDKVDLGVESFIRTRQATVVAFWGKARSEPAVSPAMPKATAQMPQPTRPIVLAEWPPAQPTPTDGWSQAPAPTPHVEATAAIASTTALVVPTSQPAVAGVSSPLLVSDPDPASMARIDAEMGRSAVGRPVQIRYSEATLNREVATLLSRYPDLPYQNVHVDLRRDHVVLTGSMMVMGFQVNAEVEGTVVARDCLPQAEIERISVAGIVTPGFVRDNIKNVIAESLSWYPADYPLCLEQIVLEEDWVTIYGSRR